jgi:O-antigen/teichoic acid export membrane protein
MSTPRISVVINNFNYARFLPRSIESALDQSYPGVEVVVVDDASTDGSQEIIRGYGQRITAVLQHENRGQGAAFNAGVSAASGDVVMMLDADDYLHPDAARRVAEAWRPGLSKLHYRLDLVDVEGRVIGKYPAQEIRLDEGDVVPLLLESGRYETAVTSGNAFARESLRRVLPVPEADFRISADGYLCTVVPFHGPVASIDTPLGAYRIHGANAWAVGPTLLAERLRRSLQHDEHKYAAIAREAAARGLVPAPSPGLRDTHHLGTRVASLALEPARHPFADDRRTALALRGARVAAGSPVALPWRAFLVAWFLAVGFLPRPMAATLVRWRLMPDSRPAWLSWITRRGRGLLNRSGPSQSKPEEAAPASPSETAPAAPPRAGSGIARNTLNLVGGQAATTLMAIALSSALGRFLGSGEFGTYFLLGTMATFACEIVSWGQGLYLVREVAREPGAAGGLLGSALTFRSTGTLLVLLPSYLVAVAAGYDAVTRVLVLAYLVAGLPFFLAQAFGLVFRGRDMMGRDAAITVVNKGLTLVLAMAALLLGRGIPGVLAAQGIAGLGALGAAVWLYRRLGSPRLAPSVAGIRAILVGGTPIVALSITTSVQPYVDAIILSRNVPDSVIGWYGAARTIAGTLMAPSFIIASASYPALSRSAVDTAALRSTLRVGLRPLVWLGTLGAVGTYLFASAAISITYGSRGYAPAATVLQVFAPTLLLLFVDVYLAHAIAAINRARELALAKVASVVVSTGLSLVLVPLLQARAGNGGIGIVIAFGLSEFVMFGAAAYLLPRGSIDPAIGLDALRALAAGAATLLVWQAIPEITPFVAMPLSVVVYTALTFAFGLVTRRDLATVASVLRLDRRAPSATRRS